MSLREFIEEYWPLLAMASFIIALIVLMVLLVMSTPLDERGDLFVFAFVVGMLVTLTTGFKR